MATDTMPMRAAEMLKGGDKSMKETPMGKIGVSVICLILTIMIGYVFNTVNSHERLIASHGAEIANLAHAVENLQNEMRGSFRELRQDIKESRR